MATVTNPRVTREPGRIRRVWVWHSDGDFTYTCVWIPTPKSRR